MIQECPTGIKVMVGIVALISIVFAIIGFVDAHTSFTHGHTTYTAPLWLSRLILAALSVLWLGLLWKAAKGRVWAWYALLAFFAIDLITIIVNLDFGAVNWLFDIIAIPMLVSAIRDRRQQGRQKQAEDQE